MCGSGIFACRLVLFHTCSESYCRNDDMSSLSYPCCKSFLVRLSRAVYHIIRPTTTTVCRWHHPGGVQDDGEPSLSNWRHYRELRACRRNHNRKCMTIGGTARSVVQNNKPANTACSRPPCRGDFSRWYPMDAFLPVKAFLSSGG